MKKERNDVRGVAGADVVRNIRPRQPEKRGGWKWRVAEELGKDEPGGFE